VNNRGAQRQQVTAGKRKRAAQPARAAQRATNARGQYNENRNRRLQQNAKQVKR